MISGLHSSKSASNDRADRYASSDAGDRLYRGSAQGNVSGKGDGVGVIEVDKVSPSSKALCPSHHAVV